MMRIHVWIQMSKVIKNSLSRGSKSVSGGGGILSIRKKGLRMEAKRIRVDTSLVEYMVSYSRENESSFTPLRKPRN
jgi:hypothetical protein